MGSVVVDGGYFDIAHGSVQGKRDGSVAAAANWRRAIDRARRFGMPVLISRGRWDIGAAVTEVIDFPLRIVSDRAGVLFGSDATTDQRTVLDVVAGGSVELVDLNIEDLSRMVSVTSGGNIPHIRMHRVKATGVNALLYHQSGFIDRLDLDHVDIDGCLSGVLSFGPNSGGRKATADHVTVRDGVRRGIRIGSGLSGGIDPEGWETVSVESSHVSDFAGEAGQDVNGIQTMAETNTISDSTAENITQADTGRTVEAFYTKGRVSTIEGCTAVDAGARQGAIVMKGGSAARAHGVGNYVLFTKPQIANITQGIVYEAEYADSAANVVEGIRDTGGIGIEFDEGACAYVTSKSDTVRLTSAKRGLLAGANANAILPVKIDISDFTADDLTGTDPQAIVIRGKAAGAGVKSAVINGTTARDMAGNSVGVYVDGDGPAAVQVVDICGGHFEDLWRAAQFAGTIDRAHVGGRKLVDVANAASSGIANVTALTTSPDTVVL